MLPIRFGKLVTLLVRTSLDTMTPNQISGDIMTDDAYKDDDEKKEKNKEKKDEKNSVAFKATSSSKSKAKQDTSSEYDDLSFDDMDDEKMALFVKRFDKLMVKDYRARRKKSSSKNKKELRRCFKCGSKDHLVTQCTYNSDNDDDDNKSKKKDKKEKREEG
jgi:hypothetical protein